jgi:hypothetical protein
MSKDKKNSGNIPNPSVTSLPDSIETVKNEDPAVKEENSKKVLREIEKANANITSRGFFIREGRYYQKVKTEKNTEYDKELSNFVMEIIYHFVDGSNNTRRLIRIRKYSGGIHNIEVYSSETSPEKFEVILKSHSCSFFGSRTALQIIFSCLMDHQKEAIAITTLGFQPVHNIYAFSNTILSENTAIHFDTTGIASFIGQTFYIPAFAEINQNNPEFINDRNFEFRPGNIDFGTWARLIFDAYGINGIIGILFTINSLFRDIFFEDQNFFPFLFLFGPAGVGKTSFIDLFLKLFGRKESGESLKNSTIKGIARKCSQRKNAIVFLKEYDVGLDRQIIKLLKDAYDGSGYTRAQTSNDRKTDTITVESAIFIDGNVLPSSESALFDRVILLKFETDSHTKEETAAFNELLKESEAGLGQVVHEILKQRHLFKAKFKATFREMYNCFKSLDTNAYNVDISEFPDRTIKHVVFLLTPFEILRNVLDFSFLDTHELIKKVLQDAANKVDMLTEMRDVNIFWDAVNFDAGLNLPTVVNGRQYQRDDYKKILNLKLKEIFPVYVDYCKRNNIQFIDFHSLESLLTSGNYAFVPSPQKGRGNRMVDKFGRCIQLSYETDGEYIAIKKKRINLK